MNEPLFFVGYELRITMLGKLIDLSVKFIRKYLPDPFVFAIILTVLAGIAAIAFTGQSPVEVVENWGGGVWSLLAFSMQMALVLVCGSALADAPLVKKGLRKLAAFPKTPAAARAAAQSGRIPDCPCGWWSRRRGSPPWRISDCRRGRISKWWRCRCAQPRCRFCPGGRESG